MLKVILVRHGETDWNHVRRIQGGDSDTPLNETGKRQAKGVGLRLKDEKILAIYSSPLQRAMHTAQAIAQHHKITIEVKPTLKEIMVGEMEGMLAAEMKPRFDELICRSCGDKSTIKLPGGESISDVRKRAWDTLQEITSRHSEGTVVVVSHYFVILSLVCTVLNLPLNEITRMRSYPGTITIITVESDSIRLELFNDSCHTLNS